MMSYKLHYLFLTAMVLVLGLSIPAMAQTTQAMTAPIGSPAGAPPSDMDPAANPMGGMMAMPGMSVSGGADVAPTPADAKVNPESIPAELLILKKVEAELKEKFKSDVYTPANIPSLFFTPAQQSLLNDARQGFNNALPDDVLPDDEGESLEPIAPSIAEISLGGILYNGSDNWIIWLNGVRTTSKNLPKQVIDIQVTGEYVQLKWFDEATNQIFPVRLRPNQKFDITKKVFLPAG